MSRNQRAVGEGDNGGYAISSDGAASNKGCSCTRKCGLGGDGNRCSEWKKVSTAAREVEKHKVCTNTERTEGRVGWEATMMFPFPR